MPESDMPDADDRRVVTPFDFLNPNTKYASKDKAAERLNICSTCEFFSKYKVCRKCGCAMIAKTKLAKAFCPVHKW